MRDSPDAYAFDVMAGFVAQHAALLKEAVLAYLEAGYGDRHGAAHSIHDTLNALDKMKKPLRVTASGVLEFRANAKDVQCPKARNRLRSAVFDFWFFRGQVYEPGSDGLCGFCQHQLACAVRGGEPEFPFRYAKPKPVRP